MGLCEIFTAYPESIPCAISVILGLIGAILFSFGYLIVQVFVIGEVTFKIKLFTSCSFTYSNSRVKTL